MEEQKQQQPPPRQQKTRSLSDGVSKIVFENNDGQSVAGAAALNNSAGYPDPVDSGDSGSCEQPEFAGARLRQRHHRKNSDPLPGSHSEEAHLTLLQQFDELAHRAKEGAEQFVHHVWETGWRLTDHCRLPEWMKDNDFLVRGHRPQLNSFSACFRSIFRIHTETGNIWTHMLGCLAFFVIGLYYVTRPNSVLNWQDKIVFSTFFLGAVLCLGFSFVFHTVYCHSEKIGRLFNKLDYCGISLLIMGSFVPWLYYSFYCQLSPKVIYVSLIMVMGSAAIVVSMFDAFSAPRFRPFRAGIFIALGLSGVIPAAHYVAIAGLESAIYEASMGWLVLMAVLYIVGAVIYALRFPERLFPGKFDIWFQSHQIFHVFVVVAAFVHYHGITEIATWRLSAGECVHGAQLMPIV